MDNKINRLKGKLECLQENDYLGLLKIFEQERIDEEFSDFEDELIFRSNVMLRNDDDQTKKRLPTIWEDEDGEVYERDEDDTNRPKKESEAANTVWQYIIDRLGSGSHQDQELPFGIFITSRIPKQMMWNCYQNFKEGFGSLTTCSNN